MQLDTQCDHRHRRDGHLGKCDGKDKNTEDDEDTKWREMDKTTEGTTQHTQTLDKHEILFSENVSQVIQSAHVFTRASLVGKCSSLLV